MKEIRDGLEEFGKTGAGVMPEGKIIWCRAREKGWKNCVVLVHNKLNYDCNKDPGEVWNNSNARLI